MQRWCVRGGGEAWVSMGNWRSWMEFFFFMNRLILGWFDDWNLERLLEFSSYNYSTKTISLRVQTMFNQWKIGWKLAWVDSLGLLGDCGLTVLGWWLKGPLYCFLIGQRYLFCLQFYKKGLLMQSLQQVCKFLWMAYAFANASAGVFASDQQGCLLAISRGPGPIEVCWVEVALLLMWSLFTSYSLLITCFCLFTCFCYFCFSFLCLTSFPFCPLLLLLCCTGCLYFKSRVNTGRNLL